MCVWVPMGGHWFPFSVLSSSPQVSLHFSLPCGQAHVHLVLLIMQKQTKSLFKTVAPKYNFKFETFKTVVPKYNFKFETGHLALNEICHFPQGSGKTVKSLDDWRHSRVGQG